MSPGQSSKATIRWVAARSRSCAADPNKLSPRHDDELFVTQLFSTFVSESVQTHSQIISRSRHSLYKYSKIISVASSKNDLLIETLRAQDGSVSLAPEQVNHLAAGLETLMNLLVSDIFHQSVQAFERSVARIHDAWQR